ncbi:MAG: hypothetical protein ACRC33_16735 [Gemmataceae bacterium]
MSEQEIEALAGLVNGMPRERFRAIETRLPPYEARDRFEDGYLTGLSDALRFIEAEVPGGEAASRMRELLGVAAMVTLNYRKQINAIRTEVNSPEFRRYVEEEFPRILSGEVKTHSLGGVLEEIEARHGKGGSGA